VSLQAPGFSSRNPALLDILLGTAHGHLKLSTSKTNPLPCFPSLTCSFPCCLAPPSLSNLSQNPRVIWDSCLHSEQSGSQATDPASGTAVLPTPPSQDCTNVEPPLLLTGRTEMASRPLSPPACTYSELLLSSTLLGWTHVTPPPLPTPFLLEQLKPYATWCIPDC
jgi:hypothetical protein